jgi:hypothetical protein
LANEAEASRILSDIKIRWSPTTCTVTIGYEWGDLLTRYPDFATFMDHLALDWLEDEESKEAISAYERGYNLYSAARKSFQKTAKSDVFSAAEELLRSLSPVDGEYLHPDHEELVEAAEALLDLRRRGQALHERSDRMPKVVTPENSSYPTALSLESDIATYYVDRESAIRRLQAALDNFRWSPSKLPHFDTRARVIAVAGSDEYRNFLQEQGERQDTLSEQEIRRFSFASYDREFSTARRRRIRAALHGRDSEAAWGALLESSGFVMGEVHQDSQPKQWLLDNLAAARAHGVGTLYLEGLYPSHQQLIDAYLETGVMDSTLDTELRLLEETYSLPEGMWRKVFAEAQRVGVRIVGVDSPDAWWDMSAVESLPRKDERIHRMNGYSSAAIRRDRERRGVVDEKFIALVGSAHTSTFHGGSNIETPGLDMLLGVPAVTLSKEGDLTLLEPRFDEPQQRVGGIRELLDILTEFQRDLRDIQATSQTAPSQVTKPPQNALPDQRDTGGAALH